MRKINRYCPQTRPGGKSTRKRLQNKHLKDVQEPKEDVGKVKKTVCEQNGNINR